MPVVEKIVNRIGQALESELLAARPTFFSAGDGDLQPASTKAAIYQSCTLPTSITLADYKDALSGANPQGDLFAALRLRELADPVPMLGDKYTASQSSIEAVYGRLVKSASVPAGPSYLTSMLADAKRKFEVDYNARMEGGGEWRPVEAVPGDWYTDDPGRYSWIEVPLGDDGEPEAGLVLTLSGQVKVPLAGASTFTRCRLQYMLVQFRRPWMDFALFQTRGWWLEGQRAGYCSSGRSDTNDGVLPLITTGMVIVRAAEFDGDLHPELKKRVDDAIRAGKDVHIGPFRLTKPSAPAPSVDVVAWRSELVPLSPRTSGPRPGCVRLRNAALIVTRCVVKWQLDGDQKSAFKLLAGTSSEIVVPAGASKVTVEVLISTGLKWNSVFNEQYPEPPTKKFVIRGTLFDAKVTEE